MFGRTRHKRPVVSAGESLGELTVRIIRPPTDETHGNDEDDDEEVDNENPYLTRLGRAKAFFVACPRGALVRALIQRLGGPYDIPEDLITLYYCGSELNVADKIPSEAFELNTFEDSDEDIFFPRIYCHIDYDPSRPDAPETQARKEAKRRADELAREMEEAVRIAEVEKKRLAREAAMKVGLSLSVRLGEGPKEYFLCLTLLVNCHLSSSFVSLNCAFSSLSSLSLLHLCQLKPTQSHHRRLKSVALPS